MIVCVDIGGTSTRVAISSDGKSFFKQEKFETHKEFSDEIEKIIKTINPYSLDIKHIVIGTAGVVDRSEGRIVWWGQTSSWTGKNIFVPLKKIFPKAQLIIENDAALAAFGEAIYGAGKDYSIIGYITLSTGIGGGLVVNRKIAPYKVGFEVGHQIINLDEKESWSCGQKGCFEAYASGVAFKKIFGVAAEECNDVKIWRKYTSYLSAGVANAIVMWSPEILILGGGISNKAEYFIDPLKRELKRIFSHLPLPDIVKAELDEPGLYGGLALV